MLNKDNCQRGAGLRLSRLVLLGPHKQGHRGGSHIRGGGWAAPPDAVEKARGGVSLDPGCAVDGRRLVLASGMAWQPWGRPWAWCLAGCLPRPG